MKTKDKEGCCGVKSSLWRLRVNWLLAMLVSPTLYSISTMAYLTSFHRFVTNPRKEFINNTFVHDDKVREKALESNAIAILFPLEI